MLKKAEEDTERNERVNLGIPKFWHRGGQNLGICALSHQRIISKGHLGNKTLEMKNIEDQRAETNVHDFLRVLIAMEKNMANSNLRGKGIISSYSSRLQSITERS